MQVLQEVEARMAGVLPSSTTRPQKSSYFFGVDLIYKAQSFKVLPSAV